MLSGPGPPEQIQELIASIGILSSQDDKENVGIQLLQLCDNDQELISLTISSLDFLSLLPHLFEYQEIKSFLIAALAIPLPQTNAVVKILQQMLRSGSNPEPSLKLCRAFLESNHHDDRKTNVLLEQGLLLSLVEALPAHSENVNVCCEILRTIGAAICCSSLIRQECHRFDIFRRIQSALIAASFWSKHSSDDYLLRAIFLVSFHRCSDEFDLAWQSNLACIAPGSLKSFILIRLVISLIGKCSYHTQATVYKLLSDSISQFDSNLSLVSSLPDVVEALLHHCESLADSAPDECRATLLSLLNPLLAYRPSAVAAHRLICLIHRDPTLLEFVVKELLLPGVRTPFIRFSLQQTGVSCLTCPLLDMGKWPPQKGYSIGLWFIIDCQASDLRLASIGGIIDLYIHSGNLKLESKDQSVTFTGFEWVTGVWYHLVVTHERRLIQSSIVSIYVNGELVEAVKFSYPSPQSPTSQSNGDQNVPDPRPCFVLGTGPVYSQPGSNTGWRTSACVVANTLLSSSVVSKWFGFGRLFQIVGGAQKIIDQTSEYIGSTAAIEVALINMHPNHEKSQHTRSLSLLSETGISEQFIPGNSVVCSIHAVQSRLSLFPYPNSDFIWVLSTGSTSVQDDAQSVGDVTCFSPFGLASVLASVGGLDYFLLFLSKSRNTTELNLRLLAIVLLLRDSAEAMREIVTNSKFLLLAFRLKKLSHIWDSSTLHLILAISGLSNEGKQGRISNSWAFQNFIMDLSIWEQAQPSLKKQIIKVVTNVIAVHPLHDRNLSTINSGANPVSRILGILGNEDIGHEMVGDLIQLLAVFVSRSSNPDDFAMVCDSAIAAVQIKKDELPSSSKRLHGAHSFDETHTSSFKEPQPKTDSHNAPASPASSVKLDAYSTWALDRRLKLLEMLLMLVQTAYEEGNQFQLKVYAESLDSCFLCSLVSGGGHPQLRMVEIALQLMNLFSITEQPVSSNFASSDVLSHLLESYASCPEVYALLILVLCGRPYMDVIDGKNGVSLAGLSIPKLVESILLLPAQTRKSSFPGAAFILMELMTAASKLQKRRASATQRQGSNSAIRNSSVGVTRRLSNRISTPPLPSPAHRRSVSPEICCERLAVTIPDEESSEIVLSPSCAATSSDCKQTPSPRTESKRHSHNEVVRTPHLRIANTSLTPRFKQIAIVPSLSAVDLDFLCQIIQGIIDVLAMSSASSTTSDPLKPLYSIPFITKVAQVIHLFESIYATQESVIIAKLETLLIDVIYRALFHSRSDQQALLRQVLLVIPVETCIDSHQSRWLTLLFNRLSDIIYSSFDLQQNSLLRASLLATANLLQEHVHLGRYAGDSLDLLTRFLKLARHLGDQSPTSDYRSSVSQGLINTSKSMVLFQLCRRDVIPLQDKFRLHLLVFENAHLLMGQEDADFAGCVLYHAGLHLIHDNLNIQSLGINLWRWVLQHQFGVAESFLIWHYESSDGLELQECNLLNNSFDRLLRYSDEKFSQWLNRSGNREAVATMTTGILRPMWQQYESLRQRECLDQMSKRSALISELIHRQMESAEKELVAKAEMEFAVLHQLKKIREKEVLRLLSAKQNVEEASKAAVAKWDLHVLQLDRIGGCHSLSFTERDPVVSITWKDLWLIDLTEGPNRIRSKLKHSLSIQKKMNDRHSFPTLSLNIDVSVVDNESDAIVSVKQVSLNVRASRRRPPNTPHSRSRLSSFSIAHITTPVSGDHHQDHDSNTTELPGDQSNDLCEFWLRGEQRLRIMLEPDCLVQAFYPCRQVIGLDEIDCIFVLCATSMSLISGYKISESGDVVQSTPSHKRHGKSGCVSGTAAPHDIDQYPTHWKFEFGQLSRITKCRHLLLPCGVELSFNDGNNFLLVFSVSDRKDFYDLLIASCPRLMDPESNATLFNSEASKLKRLIKQTMNDWLNGQLSNFDYLMQLSLLSNRTFNDLTQYPVFPWVVQDFYSDNLDLESPSTFRDLRKPIGALDPSRERMFRERFEAWDDPAVPRFHYGTHYSSAPVVLSYLVRLEPFTSQFKRLHGGRFDKPDRMFHDIGEWWNMCSGTNAGTSDVRELLPEFYFMPEFLINGNKLELGTRSSGVETNDVILPPWASSNPRKFISIHRRALESDHVSANLHHWIDLIYGYKQQDQAAVDACNVFYYTSYEGKVDFMGLENDPVRKSALIEQVRSFGQTPKQLFTKPHPARAARSDIGHLARHPDHIRILDGKSVGFPTGCIALNGNKAVTGPLFSAFIGPSNSTLATWSTADGIIRVVSCSDNDPAALIAIKATHSPGSVITCLQISFNGMVMVTGSTDTCIVLFKRTGPKPDDAFVRCGRLDGHIATICSVAVSTEFSMIVSASVDNVILVWDLNLLDPVGNLDMPLCSESTTSVLAIDSSGNGDIAVGCQSNAIRIWDRNCHLVASTKTMPISSWITSITFCTSINLAWSTCLITGHADGAIGQWFVDFDGEMQCRTISCPGSHTAPVSTLMVSSDANQLWSGDTRGMVLRWGIPSEVLAELRAGPADAQLCPICTKKFKSKIDMRQFCPTCQATYCSSCWMEHYRVREEHRLSTRVFGGNN